MAFDALKGIRGFLFDLDGVFFVGTHPVPGGPGAIEFLKTRGIPRRFTTNTTTRSRDTMHGELVDMGLPIEKRDIFSAPQAAVAYLRKQGRPTIHLVLNADTSREFAEFPADDQRPEYIVVGDIGNAWNYDLMNRLFNMVIEGSKILALHKGRYWQRPEGLRMDIGAFVAGLEYVTGKEAIVMGKPSTSFFGLALDDLGLPASEVVMIGDDINNDVAGAQQCGMRAVLVKTGKYREHLVAASSVKPDLVIESIADLPGLLS